MSDDEMPKHKPLKKCVYCHGDKDAKRDALWTVTYYRELALLDRTLKVNDPTCDEHIAVACSRASRSIRVRPRFLHGPGGMRVMPNGMAPSIGG